LYWILTQYGAALQHENCEPFLVAMCNEPFGYAKYFAAKKFLRHLDLQVRVRLIGGTTAKQMAVATACHPFGASQMALEGCPRALGIPVWIDVKHDARHLPPVGITSVCIQ
jgi:hypothetical protein